LVRSLTRIIQPPFVPELRIRVADTLTPTWEATERYFGHAVQPPFWAFVWPGSQALARLMLDSPDLVSGKRVFDFGSGCGLAAIAAIKCGAVSTVACDVDPLAASAQEVNALLNGVTLQSLTADPTRAPLEDVDLVLAGDVCYERFAALRNTSWLRTHAEMGVQVLLADPGRAYAPSSGLELIAEYEVPTTRELETAESLHTTVWRVA